MLTATKKTNIEDDSVLLSTVTTNIMLNQLRTDSDYDEEDDELTTRPTPTGSPPPVSVTTANSAGINKLFLINNESIVFNFTKLKKNVWLILYFFCWYYII
jgi:hypothetical protein